MSEQKLHTYIYMHSGTYACTDEEHSITLMVFPQYRNENRTILNLIKVIIVGNIFWENIPYHGSFTREFDT